MGILEVIQLVAGSIFLILGMIIFAVQIFGVYRFSYVLNRMHAAALGDTLGISLSLIGLMIFSGFSYLTLKLGLVIAFLWVASPAASHLIARLEVTTNENSDAYQKEEV